MKATVHFYFKEVASAIECTSVLNDKLVGVGKVHDDAMEDYILKYNAWAREMDESARSELDLKGVDYELKKMSFKLG